MSHHGSSSACTSLFHWLVCVGDTPQTFIFLFFDQQLVSDTVTLIKILLKFYWTRNKFSFSANRRSTFSLPRSLAQSALGNQLAKSVISQGNFIPETPTPTKILYPKQVTKDQQEFADGFASKF